jgi:hypothetical protein
LLLAASIGSTERVIPTDWTPCRRPEDGELVGYTSSEGSGVVPLNLFGHPLAGPLDLAGAERVLTERGLSCLAEPWRLKVEDGQEMLVLILSATPDRIVVAESSFGVVDPYGQRATLDVEQARQRLAPAR